MTKIEFLSASLPYELKVRVLCGDGVFDTTGDLTVKSLYELGESRFTPIVRPLSDLTKPIVQADYNDGNPFIPIMEIQKRNDFIHIMGRHFVIGVQTIYEIDELPTWVTQLLLKWHFWPNMPEGEEVVWVTDEFNPYK